MNSSQAFFHFLIELETRIKALRNRLNQNIPKTSIKKFATWFLPRLWSKQGHNQGQHDKKIVFLGQKNVFFWKK